MNENTDKQHKISADKTNKKRYLVASKRGTLAVQSGMKPMLSFELKTHLAKFPNIKICKTIGQSSGFSPQSIQDNEAQEIHIVEMSDSDHKELKANSPGHVLIEEEQRLEFLDTSSIKNRVPSRGLAFKPIEEIQTYSFLILGEENQPLSNVDIVIQSSHSKGMQTSNDKGEAFIELAILANTQIESIFAKAKTGYWDFYLKNPDLATTAQNIIRLNSLSETIPNFPVGFQHGWGEKLMGLGNDEKLYTGTGVKIAIVDTGLGEHRLLSHVKSGSNLSDIGERNDWRNDQEGHGTHVAGVITANGDGDELSGFCPEAEILILKVFPGGTTSSLVRAIDICINERIDVVNMSLGTKVESPIVAQKIEEAILNGIGVIVSAGNSGGEVQFPANLPTTLAVSAIGDVREVQADTWDSTQVTSQLTLNNGLFFPQFSCFGPQIDVTAPGVAIVSTGPDNTYFPDSGTSMAAPHVTGLAGLLLAHHPLFRSVYVQKNQMRVTALYELLRRISIPFYFGPGRTGSGMPAMQSILAGHVNNTG